MKIHSLSLLALLLFFVWLTVLSTTTNAQQPSVAKGSRPGALRNTGDDEDTADQDENAGDRRDRLPDSNNRRGGDAERRKSFDRNNDADVDDNNDRRNRNRNRNNSPARRKPHNRYSDDDDDSDSKESRPSKDRKGKHKHGKKGKHCRKHGKHHPGCKHYRKHHHHHHGHKHRRPGKPRNRDEDYSDEMQDDSFGQRNRGGKGRGRGSQDRGNETPPRRGGERGRNPPTDDANRADPNVIDRNNDQGGN